ncbi:phage head closure protein [Chelativorans intermedius]|uniref:Phage head closure protein n=1 Tax=Chelativorans intermedius TaxID=515947 RepID=A0ABV6DC13_9HYPH|nr:phage head closure protein [Chelativorans intermedius]MCT8999635.1 phage head closure protein [Chelativorans intermedius]
MTAAGDLDRRIVIERSIVVGHDEYNYPIYDWQPLATVSASRSDVSDTERAAYGTIVSELVSRFVIRAGGLQSSVRPTDRLAYDGRTWNIMGVKETKAGRNRFLEITAKTGG